MANLKTSIKSIRQIEKRTLHNRNLRTKLKTLYKQFNGAKDDQEKAAEIGKKLVSAVDKAAKIGLIHKNKADRTKAACHKYISPAT